MVENTEVKDGAKVDAKDNAKTDAKDNAKVDSKDSAKVDVKDGPKADAKSDDEATESTRLNKKRKDKYTDIGSQTDIRMAKKAENNKIYELEKEKILKRLHEIGMKHEGKAFGNLDLKFLQDMSKSHKHQIKQPNVYQPKPKNTS